MLIRPLNCDPTTSKNMSVKANIDIELGADLGYALITIKLASQPVQRNGKRFRSNNDDRDK